MHGGEVTWCMHQKPVRATSPPNPRAPAPCEAPRQPQLPQKVPAAAVPSAPAGGSTALCSTRAYRAEACACQHHHRSAQQSQQLNHLCARHPTPARPPRVKPCASRTCCGRASSRCTTRACRWEQRPTSHTCPPWKGPRMPAVAQHHGVPPPPQRTAIAATTTCARDTQPPRACPV